MATLSDDTSNKNYPGVAQSFAITGIMIAAILLFSPVMMLGNVVNQEALTLVYEVLAVGTPCWIAYAIRKTKTGRTSFTLAIGSGRIVPLLVIAAVALLLGVAGPISNLIPVPEGMRQGLIESFNQTGIFTFAMMVIAAPVLEELLFRGIILDGLLRAYSPTQSILVSSFLFGIAHLNPWQFVAGMVMGVFAGWVYYRSRSLVAAIVVHAAANLMGFLVRVFYYDAESLFAQTTVESFGGPLNYGMFIAGSTLVLSICIHLLNKEFAKPEWSSPRAVAPSSSDGDPRSLVLLSAALVVLGTAHSASAAQRSDDGLVGAVDALVAARLQQPGGVGFSVAIARGGEVILAKGYGRAELEHDVAVDADTLFRVGSVTKQFTAAAIMRLVEQDKLSLDDDITTYLPGFDTRGHSVTIRHLLAHTSGIKSYTGVDDFWRTGVALELSVDELLAYVEDQDFDFAPGEQFKYSNTNYYMLGATIQEASGVPYCQFLQDELFTPLNLSRIRCDSNAEIIANRAQGYRFEAGKLTNDGLQAMENYGGAGMIIATAGDLVAWEMALVGGEVVSAESLQQMITPSILPSGQSTGYGFGLNPGQFRGHRAIVHSGGLPGFGAMLAYFPDDDLYIAVISNVFEGRPAQSVAREIAAAVFGSGAEESTAVDLGSGAASSARSKASVGPMDGRWPHNQWLRTSTTNKENTMNRYLFLSCGFEKPTPEIMSAWETWFASIADRTTDQGGLWGGGREITENGTDELPLGEDSVTGFIIFNAGNLDEAERIARDCPIVASNRVYEIMTK